MGSFIDVLVGIFGGLRISWMERFATTGGEDKVPSMTGIMMLERLIFTNRSTIGELYLDDSMECYILEPTCRVQSGVKLAIPQGKYEVVMYASPKLAAKVAKWKAEGRILDPLIEAARVPLLLKVPGHDFVEMHPGNGPGDTEDCLLPGKGHDTDWVSDSEAAWIHLVTRIEEKLALGPFYIGITGGGPTA